jgi:hypothetical protein
MRKSLQGEAGGRNAGFQPVEIPGYLSLKNICKSLRFVWTVAAFSHTKLQAFGGPGVSPVPTQAKACGYYKNRHSKAN